jgi:hypothetical protein
MILSVGLENQNNGHALAWALDFPGCTMAGADAATALVGMPQAFIKYQDWIARHNPDSWVAGIGDIDVRLVDTFDNYCVDPDTLQVIPTGEVEINAWFRHDWRPLTPLEVERGLQLLAWSRADLLAALQDVPPERMDTLFLGQRWSIRGVVKHVATAEWWYLSRLGLTGGLPRASMPHEPLELLVFVRAALEKTLPTLAGSRQVVGVGGEFWSPRKLLRRAVWHELDHIGHIYQLILM